MFAGCSSTSALLWGVGPPPQPSWRWCLPAARAGLPILALTGLTGSGRAQVQPWEVSSPREVGALVATEMCQAVPVQAWEPSPLAPGAGDPSEHPFPCGSCTVFSAGSLLSPLPGALAEPQPVVGMSSVHLSCHQHCPSGTCFLSPTAVSQWEVGRPGDKEWLHLGQAVCSSTQRSSGHVAGSRPVRLRQSWGSRHETGTMQVIFGWAKR